MKTKNRLPFRSPKRFELDTFNLSELQKYKRYTEELLKFHWDYYHELAYQRKQIESDLQSSLIHNATQSFRFQKWQRIVKYKYHPLSAKGSTVDITGGRFNVGSINVQNFPLFSALYIARERRTAVEEVYTKDDDSAKGLSPFELALDDKEGTVFAGINGELDSVFDLRKKKNLMPFLNLIKNFSVSDQLKKRAKILNEKCEPISTLDVLLDSFLTPDWRIFPTRYDVPANPQIFGQIVLSAGIQGILYPSKHDKKPCLAIYAQNFKNSSAYVEINDDVPDSHIIKRVDSSNWEQFV